MIERLSLRSEWHGEISDASTARGHRSHGTRMVAFSIVFDVGLVARSIIGGSGGPFAAERSLGIQ
jgi:hypothetical protein